MKKRFTLLFGLLLLATIPISAQYMFNLQIKTNEGGNVTGDNQYLTITEVQTVPGTRTRTVTYTETRQVTESGVRRNQGSSWTTTYTIIGTGEWTRNTTPTSTGAWGNWSLGNPISSSCSISFGNSPTYSSQTTTPTSTGNLSTVSETLGGSAYYPQPGQSTGSYPYTYTNSNRNRQRVVTETRTVTVVEAEEGTGGTITNKGVDYRFIPVPYTTNGSVTSAEPGWYYIQNVITKAYVVMNGTTPEATTILPTTDNGNGAKWRLIKTSVGAIGSEDTFYHKLVSKLDFEEGVKGGTLMHRATANTTVVSGSTDYTATNSVFLLNPVGTAANVIVKNDDQEIVSNRIAVDGTQLSSDASSVWLHGNRDVININDNDWIMNGGSISETYYRLAPVAYAAQANGANDAHLIYGEYASGLEEGDGYYFTRLDKGVSLNQNLNTYTVNTSTKVRFSIWLRGITDEILTDQGGGYCKVGTATFRYASGAPTTIDLLVPIATAINKTTTKNNPNAWYQYSTLLDNSVHGGKPVTKIEITADLGTTNNAWLDVDNIHMEVFDLTPNATFIYKTSGTTEQARQSVPQYEHVIYIKQLQNAASNLSRPLVTSTKSFEYYRWYKASSAGMETHPPRVTMYDSESSVITRTLVNGIVNFNASKNAITRGYRANYSIPSSTDAPDFFTSDDAVIYCDMSNYTDFSWNSTTTTLIEPTVSLRNVFRFKDATDLARDINLALERDTVYEYYELEAPIDSRLRLTPEHDIQVPKNYWTFNHLGSTPLASGDDLYPSDTFAWYDITSIVESDYSTGTKNRFVTGLGVEMTPLDNSKYLQISTSGKSGVEYYAVDISTSSQSNTAKRVAIFRVTYKQKNGQEGVGPQALDPKTQDIFDYVLDKKLIIEKNFDQSGTYSSLPPAFPNPQDEVSVYGMGVKPLSIDETSYGFTNPLHYAGNGAISNGNGTRGHHRAPYWSEYGFPQQINGVTGGYSWSNGSTVVSDITYLKTTGTGKEVMGNMLYVDAAELPGTFVTLNFNESFCAGAKLYCSAWIVNLNTSSGNSSDDGGSSFSRPNLVMILKTIDPKTKEEIVVKRFYTGDIGQGNVNDWYQVGFEFEIPSELSGIAADFRLEIQNNGLNTNGNDFALDDIRVYRTNPAIKAVRTNEKFCLPDGNLIVLEPLEMQVEVGYEQLQLTTDPIAVGYNQLYFRFLMPDKDGEIDNDTSNVYDNLPGYKDESTQTDPLYVNVAFETKDNNAGYYYGMIELAAFKYKEDGTELTTQTEVNTYVNAGGKLYAYLETPSVVGNPTYKDMYIHKNEAGHNAVVFTQIIPEYILELENSNYNTGQYAIYVAEAAGSLLTIDCAGEANFNIDFDKTDFDLYVGGSKVGADGSLSACTNNTVDVKAYATAGTSSEGEEGIKDLFAIYDWYYGPQETQGSVEGEACAKGDNADSASTYERTIEGIYTGDVLFTELLNAPVRDADDFKAWLETDQGKCWLANNEDGKEWEWGTPNYVGYDMFGGRWRYTISKYSTTDDVVDGVTSATILGPRDNRYTNKSEEGLRPVDFRTVKADLETYRFFYPYIPQLPNEDQMQWPIDPHNENYVESINYLTGKLTFKKNTETGSPWVEADIPDDGRLTPEKYLLDNGLVADHAIHYVTDYKGTYLKNIYGRVRVPVDDQSNPAADGVPYVRRYTATTGIEGLPGTTDGDFKPEYEFWDLNNLIARMHYYVGKGILGLYTDRVDVGIETLATTYMTVIPTSQVAFNVANINVPTVEELSSANRVSICPTPSELKLRAKSWAPDILYGESNKDGKPSMPYLNIEDVYKDEVDAEGNKVLLYEYVYTVRLPEKTFNEEKPTEQFVLPLLYFDEVKNARVKLLEVIDEAGAQEYALDERDFSSVQALEDAYIGLIDADNRNKLLRGITTPHFSYYENPKLPVFGENGVEEEIIKPYGTPQNFDVRWKLNQRDQDHALEAYPLVYNGYNYFVDGMQGNSKYNVLFNHDVELEGDPFSEIIMNDLFGFKDNKLGVEVMASDVFLRNYVDEVGSEYHFKPGYTYLFALETTGGKDWGDTSISDCNLVMKFQLKVVPDTVIWGGTDNVLKLKDSGENVENDKYKSEWNRDNNWFIPVKDSNGYYTDQASTNKTFPPLSETKVIVPVDLSTYSTLDEYKQLNTAVDAQFDEGKKIISMYEYQPPYAALGYVQTDILNPDEFRATPWIEFDYNYMPNTCDTIHFKHGGTTANAELARQDLLNYSSAKVDLTVNTKQWYGLSAPLRDMYSGDYAFPNANPLSDMRLHNTENPQTGVIFTDWTNSFNTSTVALKPGLGYSVYVSAGYLTTPVDPNDLDQGYQTDGLDFADEQTFYFPKDNLDFKFYTSKSKKFTGTVQSLETDGRDHVGRFVYETGDDNSINSPLIELSFEIDGEISSGEGSAIVVGNPFMAHINFEEFYKVNKDVIAPQYKLLTGTRGNYNAENYISLSATADSDGNLSDPQTTNGLTYTSIAPMQTFIVFSKEGVEGGTIKFTPEMSVVDAKSILRSMNSYSILKLNARNDKNLSSNALVVLNESTTSMYSVMEDSRLMTIKDSNNKIPHIFTIADEKYLDINRMDTLQQILPLGLINGESGVMTFTISGALSIPLDEDEQLIFRDVADDKSIVIDADEFVYTFDYDSSDQVGRFFILRERKPTDITTPEDSGIVIFKEDYAVQVVSLNEPLTRVEMYDVKGQLLYRQDNLNTNRLSVPVSSYTGNVLILKATTAITTKVTKVLNK